MVYEFADGGFHPGIALGVLAGIPAEEMQFSINYKSRKALNRVIADSKKYI